MATGNMETGLAFSIMGRAPDPLISATNGGRCGANGWRPHTLLRQLAAPSAVLTPIGSMARSARTSAPSPAPSWRWAAGWTATPMRPGVALAMLKGPKLGIVGPCGQKHPDNGVLCWRSGFLHGTPALEELLANVHGDRHHGRALLCAQILQDPPPVSTWDYRRLRILGGRACLFSENILSVRNFRAERLRRLATKEGKQVALVISSSQITGAAGGEWCPYGLGGLGSELPTDQRIGRRPVIGLRWRSRRRASRWRSCARRCWISTLPATSRSPFLSCAP